MGLFEGWPFKSKEQSERESREFKERVFPFGETQRESARSVLRQIVSPKMRDTEMLFAFLSAKDRYILDEKSPKSLEDSRNRLKKQGFAKERDIDLILALVQLDSISASLDSYPTAEDVLDFVGRTQKN